MGQSKNWMLVTATAACLITGPILVRPLQAAPDTAVSLQTEMKAMNKDLKALGTQLSDASKNASSLTLLADLEKHTLACKSVMPDNVDTAPDQTKKAKAAAYQTEIVATLKTELDIETAVLADKNDEAVKLLADLKKDEAQGHKDFRAKN